MHAMSFLGSSAFYLPVFVVAFWCVSPRWGARMMIMLAVSGMLNSLLKLVFHTPRPYWTDPKIKGHESQVSFGMPSGHAQNSVVVWGLAAAGLRSRAVWAGAAAMILLIGLSRIYLGVHSLGQVLAGWAIGAAILAAALVLEPVVVPWWGRRPLAVQVALGLGVALAFLGLDELAVAHLHGWHLPAEWAANIQRAGGHVKPPGLSEGAAAAGALFGGLAGVSWLAHRGWFEPGGPVGRRLARLGVGAAGAAVITLAGLAVGGSAPARFAVQAVLTLWVAAGAPETFVRLGLAGRSALTGRPSVAAAPDPRR